MQMRSRGCMPPEDWQRSNVSLLRTILWQCNKSHWLSAKHCMNESTCILRNIVEVTSVKLGSLGVKNVFANRCQLSHSSLGIVDVKLRRQVQFVVDDFVEADVTS